MLSAFRVKLTWCLTSTETIRHIKDGEKRGRGYGGGGRGRLYTYRYYYIYLSLHHQNDMGSDESHFNVLLIVMDKVTSVQKPQLLKRGLVM